MKPFVLIVGKPARNIDRFHQQLVESLANDFNAVIPHQRVIMRCIAISGLALLVCVSFKRRPLDAQWIISPYRGSKLLR